MDIFKCIASSHVHFSLFVDDEKVDAKVRQHLQLNGAKVSEGCKITVGAYGDAKQFVADLSNKAKGKIWVRMIILSYLSPAMRKSVFSVSDLVGVILAFLATETSQS